MRATPVTDTAHCPCGCGAVIDPPPTVENRWHSDWPYWEFMCVSQGCPSLHRLQRNQTGDQICGWCKHKRAFIGHFQAKKPSRHVRVTVLGKEVRDQALHSLYFKQEIAFNEQGDTT